MRLGTGPRSVGVVLRIWPYARAVEHEAYLGTVFTRSRAVLLGRLKRRSCRRRGRLPLVCGAVGDVNHVPIAKRGRQTKYPSVATPLLPADRGLSMAPKGPGSPPRWGVPTPTVGNLGQRYEG